jgi:hypothetical protein
LRAATGNRQRHRRHGLGNNSDNYDARAARRNDCGKLDTRLKFGLIDAGGNPVVVPLAGYEVRKR